ncbi:MAG: hypothetical protein U0441_24170 [Polyangiaceae bacterium]
MKRFLVSVAALGASLAVLSAAPSARASDGEAELYLLAVGVALFDAASLPVDIHWAIKGEKIDRAWSIAEMGLGGAQALAGGIGLGVCGGDPKCFHSAAFPALAVFTAWTSAMVLHGAITFPNSVSSPDPNAPSAPKKGPVLQRAASISFAPMIGDGRTTPAGIGFVGTF